MQPVDAEGKREEEKREEKGEELATDAALAEETIKAAKSRLERLHHLLANLETSIIELPTQQEERENNKRKEEKAKEDEEEEKEESQQKGEHDTVSSGSKKKLSLWEHFLVKEKFFITDLHVTRQEDAQNKKSAVRVEVVHAMLQVT